MWTILFGILMLLVFGKIFLFALRAAWGISKLVVSLVMLPIFLVGLVVAGLIQLAFPLLIIIGILSVFGMKD